MVDVGPDYEGRRLLIRALNALEEREEAKIVSLQEARDSSSLPFGMDGIDVSWLIAMARKSLREIETMREQVAGG